MTGQSTADAEDIRQLLALQARAARLVDTMQWDEVRTLWTPDAVFHNFGRDYAGPDDIVAFMSRRMAAHPGRHMVSVPQLDIDGDRARAEVDYVFFRFADLAVFSIGVYHDEFRRIDGTWFFSRREIEIHAYHPELSAAAKQTPEPLAERLRREAGTA